MKKLLLSVSSVVLTSLGLLVVATLVGIVSLPWPVPASGQAERMVPMVKQRPSDGKSTLSNVFVAKKKSFRLQAPPVERTRRIPARRDITVNVDPDGTIWVFGKPMKIEAFKRLLGDFVADDLATAVTIAPDRNCVFRYVEPLIAVCETFNVPQKIVSQQRLATG